MKNKPSCCTSASLSPIKPRQWNNTAAHKLLPVINCGSHTIKHMFKCRSFPMHFLKMPVAQLHSSLRGRAKLSLMWEYFEREEEIQREGEKRQNEENKKGGVLGFCLGVLRALLKSWKMWSLMGHKWKERLEIEEKDVSNMKAVAIKSTWIPYSMFPPTPAYFLSSPVSLPPSPTSSLHFSFFIALGLSVPG